VTAGGAERAGTRRVGLLVRRRREQVPVTPASIALFRLGEQCNNACPMCSNSGRPEAARVAQAELLRRVDFLREAGLRRVVLTGGEPTIHPGFWRVVNRLRHHGMLWDINTHGRSFAAAGVAERARRRGLQRAIVSLHSADVEISRLMSGCSVEAHEETLAGIDGLVEAGVQVMVNCVLSRVNHRLAMSLVEFCHQRWGQGIALKFAFPTTSGKGGGWEPIHLTYAEVTGDVVEAKQRAGALGIALHLEGFPPCVLGDATVENTSRSGFGESHYLDDVSGRDLYSIRFIEAEFSGYPEPCRECSALKRCPGVSRAYMEEHGVDAFTPFAAQGGACSEERHGD